jgi:cytochrome c biogenesis protein CcmG/thiol:disulfide interchange protein DsbE
MNRITLIILISIISISVFSQTRLPAIAVRSADGEEMILSDFVTLKKPLVISFWATYCNPCLQEFEAVADLYDDWKKEIDFEFIAISIDDTRSSGKVKSLVSGKNWPFIVLIDENQDIKRAMNITDIPYYFIFDRKGKCVYRHAGYLPGDEFVMLKELKKITNE